MNGMRRCQEIEFDPDPEPWLLIIRKRAGDKKRRASRIKLSNKYIQPLSASFCFNPSKVVSDCFTQCLGRVDPDHPPPDDNLVHVHVESRVVLGGHLTQKPVLLLLLLKVGLVFVGGERVDVDGDGRGEGGESLEGKKDVR